MFIWFWLLAAATGKESIQLPEQIVEIADLARYNDYLYILDTRERTLWKTGPRGRIVASYARHGPGPGEWRRPFRLRIYDGKIYVPDLEKWMVLVLDTNLAFVIEFKLRGMARDIAVAGPHLFVAYYDALSDAMVHRLDEAFAVNRSFGRALEKSPVLMGFQSGFLRLSGDRLLFQHQFLPWLQVFDREGNLVQAAHLPGLEEPFINERNIREQKRYFRYVAADLFSVEGKPYVKLEDHLERKAYLYRYDRQTNRFTHKISCPWVTKSDQAGGFYKVRRQRETLRLEPFDIEVQIADQER